MAFASPIWLLALLPWGGFVLWLLAGRRKRQAVPFLPLWQGPARQAQPRRALESPPMALVALLVAMLLAVLAAGRPIVFVNDRQAMGITVIVDRGFSMSGQTEGERRYAALARSVQPRLSKMLGSGTVRLIDWPGGTERKTDLDRWADVAKLLPPTAVDTRASLTTEAVGQLRETRGAVVVLSDHALDVADPRVILITPTTMPEDIGIVSLTAREKPTPQVMVRVRNQSKQTGCRIRVTSGGQAVERVVALPAGATNFFIPIPGTGLGDVIDAELLNADDLDANNRAWLVRGPLWPRIEPRTALPEALRRMLAVYQRAKPATERSAAVAVVASPATLAGIEPGVVVSVPVGPSTPASQPAEVKVVADPVTRLVDWPSIILNAAVASLPPGEWTPVVSRGGRVLVAHRTEPVRQVWVGFDSVQWPRSPDYVVFWTNVFDWIGGEGAGDFQAEPVHRLGPEWTNEEGHLPAGTEAGLWPGLYRRTDGVRCAVNAPDVELASQPATDWESRLAALARRERQSSSVAEWCLLLAAACVVLAAFTWGRQRSASVVPR